MPAGPTPNTAEGHALVAALGHAWLRDQAFGIKILDALRARGVPPGVHLADWSFGTVTAFQRLSAHPVRRAIFVSGIARGRRPGTLHRFRPPRSLPAPEEIHGRIGDAVMGVVDVDNLLAMAAYYDRLPADVVLVEIEPADETWGDGLSPQAEDLLDTAIDMVLFELRRSTPQSGR